MNRKLVLYLIIIASFVPMVTLPTIRVLTSNFFVPKDVYWVLGSYFGLLGFVLLIWQFILGIKPISAIFTIDVVATNRLHKWFGMYGLFLIFIHPILLFIEYITNRGINLILPSIATQSDIGITFGKTALIIIVLTYLTSHLVRAKFSFRTWKRLHILNFLIVPIIFFHAKDIGTFINSTPLMTYFYALHILYVLIVLYKLGEQIGLFRYTYKVAAVNRITHDIVRIDLKATNIAFIPAPGQFILLQIKHFGETHPFTVSHYDETTKIISISTKSSGYFSSQLVNLKPEQEVYISGPYGVFTRQAYYQKTNKIVMIAGGIGITPFLRVADFIDKNPQKFEEALLVFGNKTQEDLAFFDYFKSIEAKSNLKFINVLSNEQVVRDGFESGFVTSDLLKKHLKDELPNYKFFICGPPIMMTKMESDLKSKGVSPDNIFWEDFSF